MTMGSYNKIEMLIYGEPYEWAMAYNVVEACSGLGHAASIFDYTRHLYRTKKFTLTNRILDRLLFNSVAKTINATLLNAIKDQHYDVLLVMKGIHLFPATITAAKQYVAHVVNWNPDDFFNPLNNSKYLLAAFDKYDCIFTPRSHLVGEYRRKGAKRVETLQWYFLPKTQYPVSISEEIKKQYGSDLAFIGTWSRRREQFLGALGGLNLRVWGNHWRRASRMFRNAIDCRPPIFGEEMCKAICASKININILTAENRDATNVRNFEIPACAGFQLCERSPEIMRLFEEGREIAFYSTPGELVSQCQYYLNNAPALNRIRQQGYQRLINSHHTMKDRVATIIAALYGNNN